MWQYHRRVILTISSVIVLLCHAKTPAKDWPSYQADNRRQAVSEESLAFPLHPQWVHRGTHAPAPAWPEMPANQDYWHNIRELNPTNTYDRAFHVAVAGDRLYYGSSAEDTVTCLDAKTGRGLWEFYTEGPVRLAPTLYQGKLYVGSDDGRVYCLDAESGELVWSHCPAGSDRRIPGNGRMISVWPVRSGVVIERGIAYACAGFFPNQGVFLCAMDAQTGKALWTRQIDVSCQGYLRCSSTHLFLPTGRTVPVAFDLKTGKKTGNLGSAGGSFGLVLDDMLVQAGNEKGQLQISQPGTGENIVSTPGLRLIAQGPMIYILKKRSLCALRREDYLRTSLGIRAIEKIDKKKRTEAQTRQLVQLHKRRKACVVWEVPCAESYALIMADKALLLGGIDKVTALSADTGQVTWTTPVKGKVYGLAVAGGCLFVSTDQGDISCLGQGTKRYHERPSESNAAERRTTGESRGIERLAGDIIAKSKVRRGYALALGAGKTQLALELVRQSDLSVAGVEEDARQVPKAREQISAAGLYGKRLSIHQGPLNDLPYQDYVANLIVLDLSQVGMDRLPGAAAVHRLLRPGGGALAVVYPGDAAMEETVRAWAKGVFDDLAIHKVGETNFALSRRQPLAQAGQWTHLYADPANTSCSDEPAVTDTLQLAWFGRPGPRNMIDRHHRSMSPLYKNGQLFICGNDRVISADAYNGTVLWEIQVPDSRRLGMMNDCGNMCVNDDTVYVAAKGQCWLIDTQTGLCGKRYDAPPTSKQKTPHWGYVAVMDDQLFGTTQKPSSSFASFGFGNLTVGQIEGDFKLKALSDSLFSVDRHTGRVLWHHDKGLILNSAIATGTDHVYFVENRNPKLQTNKQGRVSAHVFCKDSTYLVALDKVTGEVAWEIPFVFPYEHQMFLSFAKAQVIVVGSENVNKKVVYDLYAFDAATGKLNWHTRTPTNTNQGGVHGEQWQHPAIIDSRLYLTPRATRTLFEYDLRTGSQSQSKRPRWGGCGTISASTSHLFYRNANPEMQNLARQAQVKITRTTRPGCWINIIPAGGMVLIPEGSSGCTCSYPLQTSMGFIPVPAE